MAKINGFGLQEQFPDYWLLIWIKKRDENGAALDGSLLAKSRSRDRVEMAMQQAQELAPDFDFQLLFTGKSNQVQETKFVKADNLLKQIDLDIEKKQAINDAANAISNINLSENLSSNIIYQNKGDNPYSNIKK